MKFLDFMEKRVDPFIKLSLTDLARTLAGNPELIFDFSFHSSYRPGAATVTVSHYWTRLLDERKHEGMKSDVYLRAFGNLQWTNYVEVNQFWRLADSLPYPSFSKQVFSLLEDARLEPLCIKKRPGMARSFSSRSDLFQKRYRERFSYHKERKEWLDVLFCSIYLQLIERPIKLPDSLTELKPVIRHLAEQVKKARSTKGIKTLTLQFAQALPKELADMTADYFMMDPWNTPKDIQTPFPGEKNALIKDRELQFEKDQETDGEKEKLPTWHADQDQEGDSFLQFDLDEGASSDLMGEGERQAESGDQAYASLEGETRDSSGNQFDDLPSTESPPPSTPTFSKSSERSADINIKAVAIHLKPERPEPDGVDLYKEMVSQTIASQKALRRSIQKLIEQKQQAPRNDLHVGRLSKKLLRVVTEEQPRLFYKKQAESKELDVIFTLLVDCSASMHDKMHETKIGIALFHESLKSIGIPHAVTGFWEDALSADESRQPNYFLDVIEWETSLLPGQGVKTMQLQPEEDNRDGFAIREMVKKMSRRSEKHKILIVFTDGEPSAFNYQDQGIVDTHEAVLQARKLGIDVIGVLLSDVYTQDQEKETLTNIYGKTSLIAPSAEEIPAILTPLLRKLLSQIIQ
jgi:nitric oxide reductase activation protein